MLKLAYAMDEDTRIKCFLSNWIAVDENCGELNRDSNPIRLRRSHGHRKAGRPTKYYLHGITVNAIVIEAFSDEEATQIANENYFPTDATAPFAGPTTEHERGGA